MINIIGAGPIGSYTGYLLARKGFDVNIYEEHKEIGKPEHCTGIVTSDFLDVVNVKKEFLLNKISGLEVFAPDGNSISLKSKELVIDRIKFDRYLADKAEVEGCKLNIGTRFPSAKIQKAEHLIGADGPSSEVAKRFFNFKRDYLIGFQAEVTGNFDKDVYKIFLGKDYGSFAWQVPLNSEIARVGVMCNDDKVRHYLSNVLKRVDYKKKLKEYGGLIPLFQNNSAFTNVAGQNVYLAGDAAGFVKATTGGGLVPGLTAAKSLVRSIVYNEDYDSLWRKAIGKEMKMGLFIRNYLNKFSDDDFSLMVRLMGQNRIKDVLSSISREHPSKLFMNILIREPRFLYYIRHLI